MMRVRLLGIGALAAMVIGLLFWPVVLTYTFVAGERATAQVDRCERDGSGLTCAGPWTTESGDTGSGEIYGLDEDDEGRTVEVRVGPLGPYAGGFGRSWPLFLTAVPLLLAIPMGMLLTRNLYSPGKKLAARLLAEPAPFGHLLVVRRDEATVPEGRNAEGGRPYASARETAAPPAYRPVDLPGRGRSQVPVSMFEEAAGLGTEKSAYWEALGADGRPLFTVESRSGGDREPESVLIDTAGAPRLIIRRVGARPMSFTLLHPGGGPMGSILPVPGTSWGAFEIKDQQGAVRARVAARLRYWVVRIEPSAPPPFPYVALAFAFDQLRRPPR